MVASTPTSRMIFGASAGVIICGLFLSHTNSWLANAQASGANAYSVAAWNQWYVMISVRRAMMSSPLTDLDRLGYDGNWSPYVGRRRQKRYPY